MCIGYVPRHGFPHQLWPHAAVCCERSFLPKARGRVSAEVAFDYMSSLYMDGVMNLVGFLLNYYVLKHGESRRTWLKMARERQPSPCFCVVKKQ